MSNALQIDFLLAGVIGADGEPLAGGKVYTYEAGTTNNKTCWTDAGKTTAATNPIVLDSNGKANIYADGNYKFVVKTSADVLVNTWDNMYYAIPSSASTLAVVTKTADYTVTSSDGVILVNASAGNVVISLPAAGTVTGREFTIIKTDSGANTVTVDPNGSETINGDTTVVLSSQYDALRTFSDGSNWVDPQLFSDNVIIGTAADRAAYTAPFEGLLWVESDTLRIYRYRSASWVTVNNVLIGTAAERAAFSDAFEGLVWVESDTSLVYRYRSSAWEWMGAPILDEDDMASDSAESVPTQQSVKAYVDSRPKYIRFSLMGDLSVAANLLTMAPAISGNVTKFGANLGSGTATTVTVELKTATGLSMATINAVGGGETTSISNASVASLTGLVIDVDAITGGTATDLYGYIEVTPS